MRSARSLQGLLLESMPCVKDHTVTSATRSPSANWRDTRGVQLTFSNTCKWRKHPTFLFITSAIPLKDLAWLEFYHYLPYFSPFCPLSLFSLMCSPTVPHKVRAKKLNSPVFLFFCSTWKQGALQMHSNKARWPGHSWFLMSAHCAIFFRKTAPPKTIPDKNNFGESTVLCEAGWWNHFFRTQQL